MFHDKYAEDPDTAIAECRDYMLKREKDLLRDGTGMPLVRSLLALNGYVSAGDKCPLVEVVVMSRNSPETGLMVFNNIRQRKIKISRSAFTGGVCY